jgi:hypothetical protein
MVLKLGNINECSLTKKGAVDVNLNMISLLELPCNSGVCGFLKYNLASFGRSSVRNLSFDYFVDSTGFSICESPSIYGKENILIKSYPFSFIKDSKEIKARGNDTAFIRHLKSGSFEFKNGQKKILEYLVENLNSHFDMCQNLLGMREYSVNDNRAIFGQLPMDVLVEKYGANIELEKGMKYSYSGGQFSDLVSRCEDL